MIVVVEGRRLDMQKNGLLLQILPSKDHQTNITTTANNKNDNSSSNHINHPAN